MMYNYFLIIGKSNAGKTTYARKLLEESLQRNIPTVILDGDCIRNLYDNHDYTFIGRQTNVETIARLSKQYLALGILPIISMICPTLEMREQLRNLIGLRGSLVYIHGGEMWKGTSFEKPSDECEYGCIEVPDWRIKNG